MAALAALPVRAAAAQLPAGAMPPTAEVLATRIDSVVKADILARGFPGVSITVTRNGRALLDRAWGVANVTTGQKAEATTAYDIGSVAKQFTAALVLKLVDHGKLSLTDSVGRYLRGLRPEWNTITIEQLLNHTSGLPRDIANTRPEADDVPGHALVAMAARDTLLSRPGSAYAYSNTGYLLLGMLIEQVHGKPYRIVLRDQIATPLRLASLGWCEELQDRVAVGYVRSSDGTAAPRGAVHASQGLGFAGICSTAGDLAKWNNALHGGRVLSPASYRAMTTTRGAANGKYGFGLAPRTSAWSTPAIAHDGQDNGFSSHNAWFPAESLSVTLLYNALPRLEVNMADFIGTIALGGTPRPIPAMQVIALPVAATQGEGRPKFVGAYEIGAGRMIVVTFEDGDLYAPVPGRPKQRLVLQSGTTYGHGGAESATTFRFRTGADGAVTGLTVRLNGVDRDLRKVK